MTPEELHVTKFKCLNSFLFFTRYIFKETHFNKFIVSDHHRQIGDALERVARGEITRLIINIAPRYGKTELAVKMFIAWCIAQNPAAKFIHLSYSDRLALDNSEEVMDLVEGAPFKELFGSIEIKKESRGKKKWYTTEKGGVYATSAGGQVTGFGAGKVDPEEEKEDQEQLDKALTDLESFKEFAGAIVIDDANKPEDTGSELALTKVTKRFESTIRNRVNSRKTPIIVIQQRIDPMDLCGYLLETEPEEWTVLNLPCITSEGKALWPHKHTLEELEKIKAADSIVFSNQYLQDPKPREGLMYSDFGTYKKVPEFKNIGAYVDTADTGSDPLCSIVYIEPEDPEDDKIYVLDVIYTPLPMEKTEVMVSEQLDEFEAREAHIESNSGGRGFARVVNKKTSDDCTIRPFHQKKNKESRIYSNSGSVAAFILMPEGWEKKFPEFYKAVTMHKKEGKNKHDDGPDALTGVYEKTKLKRKLVSV